MYNQELPDILEQMELSAESISEDLWNGEQWLCCECSSPILNGHEVMMSPYPYCPPICEKCAKNG